MFMVSCVPQKSSEVNPDYSPTALEMESLKACSSVKMSQGFLYHQNLIDLFLCMRWSEVFPSLYSNLNNINENDWNYLMNPIDDAFFADIKKRDRMTAHFKDLNNKGGLDNLGTILTSLNDTNIYDTLNVLADCANDPDLEICTDNKRNIISKKEVFQIFSLIDFKKETYQKIIILMSYLVKQLSENPNYIREEMQKLNNSDFYKKMRLKGLDELANSFLKGHFDKRWRSFLVDTFLTKEEEKKEPFLYGWIKSDGLTFDIFEKVAKYSLDGNQNMVSDMAVLNKQLSSSIVCNTYSNNGDPLQINLKTSIENFIDVMAKNTQETYFKKGLDLSLLLHQTSEICPKINHFESLVNFYDSNGEKYQGNHDVYILDIIKSFNTLLEDPVIFQASKYLANLIISNKDIKNKTFLIEFLGDDLFLALNEINRELDSLDSHLLKIAFNLLKGASPTHYSIISEIILNALGGDTEFSNFGIFSKLWMFFSADEKNYLMNTLDIHFQGNIDYTSLFEFYLNMLAEISPQLPKITSYLFSEKNKEKTFNSMVGIFKNLTGPMVLKDLSKLISRDYILKLIEIMGTGIVLPTDLKIPKTFPGLVIDPYKDSKTLKGVDLTLLPVGPDSKDLRDCIDQVIFKGANFYDLISYFPESCQKIENKEFILQLFDWMGTISKDFEYEKVNLSKDTNFYSKDNKVGLFDNKGLFAPSMVFNTFSFIKSMDQNLYSAFNTEDKGIQYLLNTLKYYLYDYDFLNSKLNGATLVHELLDFGDQFLSKDFQKARNFRIDLTKKFVKDENFNYSSKLLKHLAVVLEDYGKELNTSQLNRSPSYEKPLYDKNFSCENYLNPNLGVNPCNTKESLKDIGTKIINRGVIAFEDGGVNQNEYLIKAMIPEEGVELPLFHPERKLFHFTLTEFLRALFDFSDKTIPFNQSVRIYLPPDYKEKLGPLKDQIKWAIKSGHNIEKNPLYDQFKQPMTTIEKSDMAFRNLQFDGGYIIAGLANGTSQENNRDLINQRTEVLKGCVKGGLCGSLITGDEKRMAANAMRAFDGVTDMSFHPIYGHELLFQTILGSVVMSSAPAVRQVYVYSKKMIKNWFEIPYILKPKELEVHNYKILIWMSELNMSTHLGRWIHDRFGRTPEEFNNYLNSKSFRILNKSWMRGFPLKETQNAITAILTELGNKPGPNINSLFEEIVDWFWDRDYDQVREVEHFIGNLLSIGSYVGAVADIPELAAFQSDEFKTRYGSLNLSKGLMVAPKILSKWRNLKNFWPSEILLLEFIKPLNAFLDFVREKLEADDVRYYRLLNDLFLVIQEVSFETQKSGHDGVDFLTGLLDDGVMVQKGIRLFKKIMATYRDIFFNQDHFGGNRFIDLGQNISRLIDGPSIDFTPHQNYLKLTTEPQVCTNQSCLPNFHFDESATLLRYLNVKDKRGRSYIEIMLDKLFLENFQGLSNFTKDAMPLMELIPKL